MSTPTDEPPEQDRPSAVRRVLILEQGFMRARRGKPVHGVELFRLNLIREMVGLGIEVTVACEQWWAEHVAQDAPGAKVVPVSELLRVVGAGVKAVRAARRAGRYDVVLFGDPGAGMIPGMLAARAGRLAPRYVAFAHRVGKWSGRTVVNRVCSQVVVNSEVVAHRYRAGGRRGPPVRVMYGVPRHELFHPGDRRDDDGIVSFILLARLPGHDKGLDVALDAFAALPENVKDRCRLHLAAFAEIPTFEDKRIIGHGWMTLEDVAALLRTMDVLLALSEHETFSQAIVQGMLTGLAIIATPIPVYVEKLDEAQGGGGGIVVSHIKAADEVARAMEQLVLDPQRRAQLGQDGRRVALERFVWNTQRFVDEVLFPASKGPLSEETTEDTEVTERIGDGMQ